VRERVTTYGAGRSGSIDGAWSGLAKFRPVVVKLEEEGLCSASRERFLLAMMLYVDVGRGEGY